MKKSATELWTPPPVDVFAAVDLRLRILRATWSFARAAAAGWPGLPFGRRIRGLLRGFTPRSVALFPLEQGHRDFLSDFHRTLYSPRINGPADHTINNKAAFPLLMRAVGLPTPRPLGFLDSGRWRSADPGSSGNAVSDWKLLLERLGALVVKPVKGRKGLGLVILKATDAGITANGQPFGEDRLPELINRAGRHLVTEFARQADYSTRIYPRTTNTVRILTLWDDRAGEAFVAAATHRFGNSRSFPADNFQGGRGGLSVDINEDGVLGRGFTCDAAGRPSWCECHPESGEQILGVQVPHWAISIQSILAAARALAFAPGLAWDVVWTDLGIEVLELNGAPGLALHQVHRPLLRDPRTREFFRRHRVIPD